METKTLMESLLDEIQRVVEVVNLYDQIPTGFIGASMMRQSVVNAKKAITEGGVVEMIRAHEDLKGYQE